KTTTHTDDRNRFVPRDVGGHGRSDTRHLLRLDPELRKQVPRELLDRGLVEDRGYGDAHPELPLEPLPERDGDDRFHAEIEEASLPVHGSALFVPERASHLALHEPGEHFVAFHRGCFAYAAGPPVPRRVLSGALDRSTLEPREEPSRSPSFVDLAK